MGNQQLLFDGVDSCVVREQFGNVFASIQEELDEHRSAINDNTSEIQSGFEVINQLSLRMDKLQERLDELTLLIKGKKCSDVALSSPLKSREKEVFKAVYELNERFAFVTYDQVARKVGLTKEMVSSCISSMTSKGVPFLKRFVGRTCLVRLESAFKEKQTKKNVVGLDVPLTHWFG